MVSLRFAGGTIELQGMPEGSALPEPCQWDTRTACFRAPANAYADIVRMLHRANIAYDDQAKKYEVLAAEIRVHREPRAYQLEAVEAWRDSQGCGVVVLPTGAGKTHVAVMAIEEKRRSALIVAPTLDLVRQWYDLLRSTFSIPIGIVGGGDYDIRTITVTTYDSAYLHMDKIGARFGLAVFDECHHLPGAAFALAARLSIAPYRLGLTATPERPDGREAELTELIGPVVYRKEIGDLAGEYLSDYETERIMVDLAPDEREEYEHERAVYRNFVTSAGIRMSSPDGWREFIIRSSRSIAGRRAFKAYQRQRELAMCAPSKLDYAEHLLSEHRNDRALLFTQDNATAYAISRRFLIPAITHQTKVRERSDILASLADGSFGAVVTSKVLNEGVDVPAANVAIVISGSGSVREHVQRLGRILRRQKDKHAILYELVAAGTGETFTSERRRDHSAYR